MLTFCNSARELCYWRDALPGSSAYLHAEHHKEDWSESLNTDKNCEVKVLGDFGHVDDNGEKKKCLPACEDQVHFFICCCSTFTRLWRCCLWAALLFTKHCLMIASVFSRPDSLKGQEKYDYHQKPNPILSSCRVGSSKAKTLNKNQPSLCSLVQQLEGLEWVLRTWFPVDRVCPTNFGSFKMIRNLQVLPGGCVEPTSKSQLLSHWLSSGWRGPRVCNKESGQCEHILQGLTVVNFIL